MKDAADIAIIVLCVGAFVLGVTLIFAFAPETAVEAPESVQAVETDDEMDERLRRVDALLERVERYLAEHGE